MRSLGVSCAGSRQNAVVCVRAFVRPGWVAGGSWFKKNTTLTTFGPQELSLSVSEPKFCEEAVEDD